MTGNVEIDYLNKKHPDPDDVAKSIHSDSETSVEEDIEDNKLSSLCSSSQVQEEEGRFLSAVV